MSYDSAVNQLFLCAHCNPVIPALIDPALITQMDCTPSQGRLFGAAHGGHTLPSWAVKLLASSCYCYTFLTMQADIVLSPALSARSDSLLRLEASMFTVNASKLPSVKEILSQS